MNRRIILLLLVISTVTSLIAQQPRSTGAKLQSIWPGRQPDGSVLLPNLWSLRPAGAQIDLGDFPVNVAVHPDNRFAAVLHCGFGQNEIAVVDIPALKVVSRTKIDEAFYGLEFSHVGNRLYCSGAGSEVIHVFNFDDGQLKADREISLRDVKERGIPGGMAVSSDAKTLYVANVWGQDVAKVDLLARTNVLAIFLGNSKSAQTSQVSTNAADFDAAAITKRAEAQFDPTTPDAPFPYGRTPPAALRQFMGASGGGSRRFEIESRRGSLGDG